MNFESLCPYKIVFISASKIKSSKYYNSQILFLLRRSRSTSPKLSVSICLSPKLNFTFHDVMCVLCRYESNFRRARGNFFLFSVCTKVTLFAYRNLMNSGPNRYTIMRREIYFQLLADFRQLVFT